MNFARIYRILLLHMIISLPVAAQYDFSANVTEGCDSVKPEFRLSTTASVDTIDYTVWDFGNGIIDTSYNESDVLIANYTMPGQYPVVVELYRSNAVVGTLAKNNYIAVRRSVTADFTFRDTTEITPMSVYFIHTDQPFVNTATYNFNWDFGDGKSGTGRRIVHTYNASGNYNVSLTVADNFGCTDTKSQLVSIIAPDALANATEACDSLKVKFVLANIDTTTITTISWDFGNGTYSDQKNPDTVSYYNARRVRQKFTIRVTIDGDTNAIVKPGFIILHRPVKAVFECSDTLTSKDNITLVCYNLDGMFDTTTTYTFDWQFEGIGPSSEVRPLVSYPAVADTVLARLTITDNTYGCSHTFARRLLLMPELLVQNVFTPNGDGVNDFFFIDSNGNIPLEIKIYTRSGLLVYQTEGTRITWHGTTASGTELNAGIYYYILRALTADPGGRYSKSGFIYLYK